MIKPSSYSPEQLSAIQQNIHSMPTTDVFELWMHKYDKQYISDQEKSMKMYVWEQNFKHIVDFNKDKSHGYVLKLNEFADMTLHEYQALKLGCFDYDPTVKRNELSLLDDTNLPKSIDWRDKGAVTPIKNQGECGSCWAFSATGSLEALNYITSGKLISFSEQQLVECSGAFGNFGCGGGLMDFAFNYTAVYGIESESNYPYKGSTLNNNCKFDMTKAVFKNSGFVDLPKNNSKQLAAAVALHPVSVGIDANSQQFMLYGGGILDIPDCGYSLDHGVLVVGYGTEAGKDYWIVKNSWGTSWGENGYVRMRRTNQTGPGICGIALAASYPTVNKPRKEDVTGNDKPNVALVTEIVKEVLEAAENRGEDKECGGFLSEKIQDKATNKIMIEKMNIDGQISLKKNEDNEKAKAAEEKMKIEGVNFAGIL
jgi:C1A family cysteine protease